MGLRSKPRHELTRILAAVARGDQPADLVIANGCWVNVHTGEIIGGTDVAVAAGRIAYVGPDAARLADAPTRRVDAAGRYLVPGLCDAHMHVESGMVTVSEFCRAVIPHGTTSMFIDPHEIANVLGLPGVRLMYEEAAAMPIGVHVQVPSCVPSAPGLEDAGAEFGPDEIAEALSWPGIVGLGEMMSFPAVSAGDPDAHSIVAQTLRAGKVAGGHFPADSDAAFHAYVASGLADDHEITTMQGAIDRARRGMRAMLRLGTSWHDVAETVRAITERGIDPSMFSLCTDDCYPATLAHEGHMDRVVRHAVGCGLEPTVAIRMATLNTAVHFGLEREIGSIAPGRIADIIVTSDLAALPIEMVFAAGEQAATEGSLAFDMPARSYPDSAKRTVRLKRELAADDFAVAAPGNGASSATARVIGIVENQAPTRALEVRLPAADGRVAADAGQDVCKAAVVERHRGSGEVQCCFVGGLGLAGRCALASTVAHDCHQLIVVGTDDSCMAQAANELAACGGGVCVVREGKVAALVKLPVAGIMSDGRIESVAADAAAMMATLEGCGCRIANAYMQISLLALAVIPQLRITNRGLVDVADGRIVPLFAA